MKEQKVYPTNILISVVGGAYFQPIADFVEQLRRMPSPNGTTDVQATRHENGYSAALCILSVIALESFLMRVRYLKHGQPTPGALSLFKDLYPTYPNQDDVAEVFVLRDLLAHNHLWEIEYTWDADGPIQLLGANHSFGGDQKYTQHVDPSARRTQRLRLHVVPNRVDRRDAALVLKTVWDALEFMGADDHIACPVSQTFIRVGSSTVPFADLVRQFHGRTASGRSTHL